MKTFLLILSLLVASHHLIGQSITKEKYNAGPWEDDAGYAQAVKVGNTIYISGHVAGGDFRNQVEQIYQSLEKTLKHFGAGFQNVVKENLYTTDIELMKSHNDIRKGFYKGDYPAATWVEINRLFDEKCKVEVELIAIMPETKD